MTDDAITIQGHVLRVVHRKTRTWWGRNRTKWVVYFDDIPISFGRTYIEATGEARRVLFVALQGPPWVPTPRQRKKRTP